MVGDGALAPPGMSGLRRGTLEPAIENHIASLREHSGHPAQVGPKDALLQPHLGARRHFDGIRPSTVDYDIPSRWLAAWMVRIQAGGREVPPGVTTGTSAGSGSTWPWS